MRWLKPVIPALWEAEMGRSQRSGVQVFLNWPTWWSLISTQNTKISWVWWRTPEVPATWEAEAGGSFKLFIMLRSSRLQWAIVVPLHSSLGNRVRLCLKTCKKGNIIIGQMCVSILIHISHPATLEHRHHYYSDYTDEETKHPEARSGV